MLQQMQGNGAASDDPADVALPGALGHTPSLVARVVR